MQTRLLSLLAQLDQPATVSGLWLVHSDEPLTIQWLIDACRPHWANNHQFIKRFELVSAKSWADVASELDSPDLFGGSTALIVAGKHKIDTKDKALMARFERFAQDVKDGNSQNHLIWCLPKQDKKSLATKAVQFFADNGTIIDGNIYDEKLRGDLLAFKAKALALNLDDTAWQMLMSHTEHNLLTAYQALWRLSFISEPNTTINPHTLQDALVAGSAFNVFDLSDALLHGNATKTIQILEHLRHIDTAPSIVLWAVAKDARLILQTQAGKHPSELGIWQNKIPLYLQRAKNTPHSSHWLSDIYAIDQLIKGVAQGDVWIMLKKLCLSICGLKSHQTSS